VKTPELDRFQKVIMQHLGLRFEDSKLDELAEALSARMKATSCNRVDTYLGTLAASREEQHALAIHLTVPETFFFRMPDHFSALMEAVLPEALGRNPRRIRILSAGCASGEEAYSIAMLVHDSADLRVSGVTIRGVDINPAVIAKARLGRYSEWSMRETKPEIQDRHFRKLGRNFQLDDAIRQMVSFEEGNLMDPAGTFWQKESCDVIFLRNVLMYFSPDAAKEVVGRVAQTLVPGGHLFLGSAETLRGLSQEFHLCHTHGSFYYQRRTHDSRTPAQTFARATTVPAPAIPPPSPTPVPPIQGDWLETIRLASQKIEDLTQKRGRTLNPGASKPGHLPAPASGADVSVAIDLMRQERFADALDALPPGTTTSADAQLLRAVILANAGRLAEAESACEVLLKSDELNAGAHYVMALCREHAGDWKNAGGHDQTAIYLDPSFAMPHLHMGLLAKRADDSAAARRALYQATLLLEREDASRILLFGGGFSREALVELCQRELKACGGTL
jgi:chemotaxis protein methyltransferase CheR